MNIYVRRMIMQHEALKHYIHNRWRMPLSENMQKVMMVVYFSIPLAACYPIMNWAAMHANSNEQLWNRVSYEVDNIVINEQVLPRQRIRKIAAFEKSEREKSGVDITVDDVNRTNKEVMSMVKNAASTSSNAAHSWEKTMRDRKTTEKKVDALFASLLPSGGVDQKRIRKIMEEKEVAQ